MIVILETFKREFDRAKQEDLIFIHFINENSFFSCWLLIRGSFLTNEVSSENLFYPLAVLLSKFNS